MRTAHLVASAAWLGGSFFYAFVLGPLLPKLQEARRISPMIGQSFGQVVSASAWTLLATGGYLSFSRLTNTRLTTPYAVVLAVKIALAIWMFLLAGALSRNRGRRALPTEGSAYARWRGLIPVPTLILVLGLVTFTVSAALTTMYGAARP